MDLKGFVDRNFLIIGICTALLVGLVIPQPGLLLHDLKIGFVGIPQVAVVVIFVVSGLTLDSPHEWKRPLPLILGIAFVLFITPLMAIPILTIFDGIVNVSLLQGMALFCAVPTTLSSGVTMVNQANGNVPLAVVLTSVTNLLGVFTMPFTVSKIFEASVPMKPLEMLFELVWLTLVPLSTGMLLRKFCKPVETFAKKWKKPLSRSQNCCIFTVVWLMTSGAQSKIVNARPSDLGWCGFLAVMLHLVYRLGAYWAATAARLPGKEWVTIVLMCSQKSLPVCVSVLSALPPSLQEHSGLMIVPCIMSHFSQLVIDSILTVRWQIPESGDYYVAAPDGKGGAAPKV